MQSSSLYRNQILGKVAFRQGARGGSGTPKCHARKKCVLGSCVTSVGAVCALAKSYQKGRWEPIEAISDCPSPDSVIFKLTKTLIILLDFCTCMFWKRMSIQRGLVFGMPRQAQRTDGPDPLNFQNGGICKRQVGAVGWWGLAATSNDVINLSLNLQVINKIQFNSIKPNYPSWLRQLQ